MPHERMSQYESSRRSQAEGIADTAQNLYGQARELVRENPAYSALATFGIGAAVGVALGLMLAPARQPEEKESSWYDNYLPEGVSAECLAKQVRETVSRILPDAINRYLRH
jgi:hypothetical protein